MLPDDVLLEIFGFCVGHGQDSKEEMKSWQLLIHVCRRWRIIVFGSPRHLNLRLLCTPKMPADDTLSIWPALPFLIQGTISSTPDNAISNNTVTMLNYSDRLRVIDFEIWDSQFGYVSAAMEKPFPELTHLLLDASHARYFGLTELVLPDLFLGGSAPRLQVISLSGIPFPGLPRLLLSATHLVSLYLSESPSFGRISPEAMATVLPALTRLETLWLAIVSSQHRAFSDAEGRRLPPSTCSVLPALTRITFHGDGEDLNTLVAQLDAPLLNSLSVNLCNAVHSPQLARFIGRAPRFKANDEAEIVFFDKIISFKLASQAIGHEGPVVSIQSTLSVSNMAHICTPPFPPFSALERLCIYDVVHVGATWREVMNNTQWLEILRPFTTVKNLYICQLLAPQIVSSLQELVDGGMIEVLPILQNIFIEGLRPSRPVRERIELLVSTRQLSGHPINISQWNRPRDQDSFYDDDFE
jgi:hypothetical protein